MRPLKYKLFLNIVSLFFIAGFLFLPTIIYAENIEEINYKDFGKYLEIPRDKAEDIIFSLKSKFHDKWIDLGASPYSAPEAMATMVILRESVKEQMFYHVVVDAPIEVTYQIISKSVKLAKIVLTQDVAALLEAIEKETVKKAVNYGINALLQNEIRVAPGVMEFEYYTQNREKKKAVFQYIMVYDPKSADAGELRMKIYSPYPLVPPRNQGSIAGLMGTPNDLTSDLPPFIVDIDGILKNYEWDGNPSIEVSFPPSVPDLGIRLLTFKEKYLLNPIEDTIKEVEIIITKVTGKSPNLTSIWEKIKTAISKITPFLPASVSNTQSVAGENIENGLNNLSIQIDSGGLEVVSGEAEDEELPEEKQMTMEEIQEILDDIAEQIDVLSQQIAGFAGGGANQIALAEVKKEVKGVSDEIEEIIDENEGTAEENNVYGLSGYQGALLCSDLNQNVQSKVIMNEIAWMGTTNSASGEWIELKNMSGNPIDIIGWQLLSKDGGIKIIFDNKDKSIIINSLFLMERTNDESVPQKTADFIYTGAVGNTNETLYLFDANCQLQDEVFANPNWPAGDNSSKRTMERISGFGWQTSFPSGGTPKEENSTGYYEYASGGGGGGSSSVQQSASSSGEEKTGACSLENLNSPAYQPIVINEVAWMGSASSSSDEWIELKSVSTSTISLNNWQLIGANASTGEGKIEIFFGGNDSIATNSFYLSERTNDESVPGITADKIFTGGINDSNFVLRLFDEKCGLIDEILATSTWSAGQKTPERKTMERKDDFGWQTSFSTTSINGLFGTPKEENSKEYLPEEPQESASTTEETGNLDVVINEIAWMGTSSSTPNDEWIELYNNTDSDIDLIGWKIEKDEGEFISISTSSGLTIIPALGFYLLERTDTSTTDVAEDQIYTGALSNSGNKLELKNAGNILIDSVDCSSGWLAGANSPYHISMERIDSESSATSTNWTNNNLITRNGKDANGNNINGTPKAKNSVSLSSTIIMSLPFEEFPELTLTFLGSPYIVHNYLSIPENKILNVEPGVTVWSDYHGKFEVDGTLSALGKSDKRIVFTSENDIGWWKGIYFSPKSKDSKLDYVDLRNAIMGEEGEPPSMLVDHSSIVFTNSTLFGYVRRGLKMIESSSIIENNVFTGEYGTNYPIGIELESDSSVIRNCEFTNNVFGIFVNSYLIGQKVPIIENNNFKNNQYPVYSYGSNIVFKDNVGQNNLNNYIIINGHIISDELTWYKNEIPYLINSYVLIPEGKKLTIEPGTVVGLKGDMVSVEILGTLIARGTEEESIFFGGNDSWCSLNFASTSVGSVLENVIVNGGGGYCYYRLGQIVVTETSIEFLNSTSSNGYAAGIFLNESPASVIKNSHFNNNSIGIDVATGWGNCPIVENLTFDGNIRDMSSSNFICGY